MNISEVWLFNHELVRVFDAEEQAVPELQGQYTPELVNRILEHADSTTKFVRATECTMTQLPMTRQEFAEGANHAS